MSVRIFSGTQAVAAIVPDDRGLAYGDGLFETMRAHGGAIPWWDAHWDRLRNGAQRLRMAVPDEAFVREQAQSLLDGGDGVLKLLLTRGSGARGYASGEPRPPTWVLSMHALPPSPPAGLALRWCQTRLALQPALAGQWFVRIRAERSCSAFGRSKPRRWGGERFRRDGGTRL